MMSWSTGSASKTTEQAGSMWFHDMGDLEMATQHSRVHQALMEGSAKIFRAWIREN